MKRYEGEPCPKEGHGNLRYKSGKCVECQRIATQKWRMKNPERAREMGRELYARDPEHARNVKYAWRENNPEAHAAIEARALEVERSKGWIKGKEWRRRNPEKRRALEKDWQERNSDKVRMYKRWRYAAKNKATPAWLTDQQKLEIQHKYLLAIIHEQVTGIKWHVDHIVPLRSKKVCGLHVPWNLQVIPAKENVRKSNKFEVL